MKRISVCILIITSLWANNVFAQTSGNTSVESFKYVKVERGISSLITVTGNTLPQDILNDISKKAPGSTTSFIDIKVSTPSGIKSAPGFTIRLK